MHIAEDLLQELKITCTIQKYFDVVLLQTNFRNHFHAYCWRSIDRILVNWILETKQKLKDMYKAFLMPEITIIWHKKKIDNIKQDTMSENTLHNWWKILYKIIKVHTSTCLNLQLCIVHYYNDNWLEDLFYSLFCLR